MQIQCLYPIPEDLAGKLFGILHTEPVFTGSVVSIRGHKYTVSKCISIDLHLYIKSGMIKVKYQGYEIPQGKKLQNFLSRVGHPSIQHFKLSTFNHCTINGLIATRTLTLIQFNTIDPFFVGW